MKKTQLTFYVHEQRKHHGILLYEWLLKKAKESGVHGGSAFRGIAGFGSTGKMHEERFFELLSNLPIRIEFFVTEKESEELLKAIKNEKLELFYAKHLVEYEQI